ncbi:MAG: MAPEG family protein [Novosphingobium sp.]|nr:MAPEG family protein [Novosphingobium sp.]
MILQTTLSLAAAAAVINLWHVYRIVKVRASGRIIHGDGGNELLMRRMRAQSNYIENAPFVLILIGAIELADKGGQWLAIVGAVFMLARLAHGIGMDKPDANPMRAGGAVVTMFTQIGLAAVAVLIALGKF